MVAGGGLLVAVVVLLALTFGELRESRENIQSQEAKATAMLRLTRPALDDVPALVEEAEPVLRRAAPALGGLLAAFPRIEDIGDRAPAFLTGFQSLVNVGVPLAQELRASDLPALFEEVRASELPTLAAELRTSDLPGLIDSLSSSELPVTLAEVDALLADLSAGDRLVNNLDTTTALLSEAEAKRLPERAVSSSRRLKDLLEVQRRAYETLKGSLRIQQETLGHVRSIDNKLGGQLPIAP